MNTEITLTELEKDILTGINNSEYGSDFGDEIWSWSIEPKIATAKQISGIVASLVKKGLVISFDTGEGRAVKLTQPGKDACIEHNLLGQYTSHYAKAAEPVVIPEPVVEAPAPTPSVKEQLTVALADTKNMLQENIKKVADLFFAGTLLSVHDYVVFWPQTMTSMKNSSNFKIVNAGIDPYIYSFEEANNIAAKIPNGHREYPEVISLSKYYALYIQWAVDQIRSVDDLIKFNNSK